MFLTPYRAAHSHGGIKLSMSLVMSGPLSIFFLDRTNSVLKEIYNSLVFEVKIAY